MSHISHDSEVPAKGQQVITACAFIYKKVDGEVHLFCPRRAQTKKFLPDVFELPGGHIDFGEDLIEGLKREIKEEFDMEVRVGDCFYAFTYLNEVKGSHSVEVIFFAEFVSPENEIKLNPEDHSEYRWLNQKEYLNLDIDKQDPEYKAVIKGFGVL